MADAFVVRDLRARISPDFEIGPVSFALGAGEILVLLGENGSGKTSLIRALVGEVVPYAGIIEYGGDWLALGPRERARQCAVVPQSEVAPFHFRAIDSVLLGRLPFAQGRWETSEDLLEARAALELVGVSETENALLENLSGGQRQRVQIARALVQKPQILLLDEPTASIDLAARSRLIPLLRELAATGVRIIVATHDLEWGTTLADQIVVLRDGRVVVDELDAEAIGRELGVEVELTGQGSAMRPRLS